jgi:hypothetical protein
MTFVRHLRHVIVLAFVWLSLGLSAQADLSGDSDNVEVVLAIFGQGGSYVDVTTRVTSLLGGDNFAPSAQILNVSNSASTGNSLIILYNFNGGRHVFVRQDIAGKINSQLLKDEAALDGQKGSPYSFDAASGDDLKLLVVLYGISIHQPGFVLIPGSILILSMAHRNRPSLYPITEAFALFTPRKTSTPR